MPPDNQESEASARPRCELAYHNDTPLVFDMVIDPLAPLERAFVCRSWRATPVDYLVDEEQDLASTAFQAKLHEQLGHAVFIAAAFACSAKSRIRRKVRVRVDGTPLPKAFRSGGYPMGLPGLVGYANCLHKESLVKDIGELLGKALLCDRHIEVPCVADVWHYPSWD